MEEMKVVILIDFEGTGIPAYGNRITEIAARAYDFEKFKVMGPENEETARIVGVEPYVTYVNPDMSIPADSTEITGISDETVKDAPTTKVALEKLYEWISKVPSTEMYLLAYTGCGYDFPILFSESARVNINATVEFQNYFKGFIDPYYWARWGKRLDTSGFVMNDTGTKPSLKQVNVYKALLKEELTGAHDALVDINGLAKISMHERFRIMWDGKTEYDNWCRTTGTYIRVLIRTHGNYKARNRTADDRKIRSKNLVGGKRAREEDDSKKNGEQSLHDILSGPGNSAPSTKRLKINKSSALFFKS